MNNYLTKIFIFMLFLTALISCSDESLKKVNTKENTEKTVFVVKNEIRAMLLPVNDPRIILTIHGSNTIGSRLIPKLVSEYLINLGAKTVVKVAGNIENEIMLQAFISSQNKAVGVVIQSHGSSTSFVGFRDQNIDIGMASRPIKQQERSQLIVKHGDLTLPENEIILGMDGLAIIVHPSNQINKLTVLQLAQIFSGKISNWASLGGDDIPISLYARDHNSGTYDTFKSMVLKPNKTVLSSQSKRFESNNQLSREVFDNPAAIGFTGMAYVLKNKVIAIADSIDSNYSLPSKFLVSTEDYPLARRLFLYRSGRIHSNPHVNQFIQFSISSLGQSIVENEEFVSQNIFEKRQLHSNKSPVEYINITRNLSRLSLNFRLKPDVSKLDSKSHRDLDRLAHYLKQHNVSEVTAIGFSGNMQYEEEHSKNLKSNRQRSLRLSYMISFGLRERGIRNIKTIGLGTLLPLVTDDSYAGIIKNSRVEIWIQPDEQEPSNDFAIN